MRRLTFLAIIAVMAAALVLGGACSSGTETTKTSQTVPSNTGATNTSNPANSSAPNADDEIPATVKAVFPDAQSFTKQHKDIPKDAVAGIEKDAGGKIPDTDHHSYLAFSTTGGARKQIGAATIVKAGAKELVIVYDSKDGSPVIKEIRGDGLPAEFLKQFAGKGHDDKFTFGDTVKAKGLDEATAKAVTTAVAVDVLTMQALYGAAHTH